MRCSIQDLSFSIYSQLDIFLHGSSSSFENHWWYHQRYHQLLDGKSASLIRCITHEFEWYRMTC